MNSTLSDQVWLLTGMCTVASPVAEGRIRLYMQMTLWLSALWRKMKPATSKSYMTLHRDYDESFLQINIFRTKYMLIDFRKQKTTTQKLTAIKSQNVERVDTYKYLGAVINSKLPFEVNSEVLYKKGGTSMFFFQLLNVLYQHFIESFLTSCMVSWFGNLSFRPIWFRH